MNADWDPLAEKTAPESVHVFGVELRKGSRVRLWPQKSADIIDMALKGQVAIIEAIEQDFDEQVHLAVVLDDDPGKDFGMLRQPGHRFFFSPDEVEPLEMSNGESSDEELNSKELSNKESSHREKIQNFEAKSD